MNRQLSMLSAQSASLLFALCTGLLCAPALAQGAPATNGDASPETRYRQDMALCKSGQTSQDKATCEREAGAALQAARRGMLTQQATPHEQYSTQRCANLPAIQRQDCMTLMDDAAYTEIQGSVAGGGILRSTTITIPANTMPSSTSPSSPPVGSPR